MTTTVVTSSRRCPKRADDRLAGVRVGVDGKSLPFGYRDTGTKPRRGNEMAAERLYPARGSRPVNRTAAVKNCCLTPFFVQSRAITG